MYEEKTKLELLGAATVSDAVRRSTIPASGKIAEGGMLFVW
jgi:hypothetical protein